MEADWRRPKVLDGVTTHIPTSSGTLHLTFNYDKNSLVEIIGRIGKVGSYQSTQLDMMCRLISIVLQTPLARVKVVKKIKKQLFDIKGEMPFEYEDKKYEGAEDYIFKSVVKEIETKELQEELKD